MDGLDHDAPPINPLPPVVAFIALLIAGVELLFQLAEAGLIGGPSAIGWRLAAITDYAVVTRVFQWMAETGQMPPEHLIRLLAYPFLHGSFMHALMAVVIFLAMGKMVGDVFPAWAVVAIFVAGTVLGGLAFAYLAPGNQALYGAFPPTYAMIGAYSWMLWVYLDRQGENRWRAFSLIGFLLAIQLGFKFFAGGGDDWIADVAGFATGFGLAVVLRPGGVAVLLARLRNR